jgi:hypothetical protein
MICSESGAEDAGTRLVSIFNVIEKVQVPRTPEPPPGAAVAVLRALPFRVLSVWMRTEEDTPGEPYEFQVALRHPGQAEAAVVARGHFAFIDLLSRVVLAGPFPLGPATGILWVECRIRRVGGAVWLKQEYPILLEEVPAQAQPPAHPPPERPDSRPDP